VHIIFSYIHVLTCMIFRESILSWRNELRVTMLLKSEMGNHCMWNKAGSKSWWIFLLFCKLRDRTFFRASLAYYPILKTWSLGACMVWTKRFRDCIYCTILMYDMSSWMAFGGEQQATIQAKLTARGFEE